jgi:hypothetical protein
MGIDATAWWVILSTAVAPLDIKELIVAVVIAGLPCDS